ncbi:MAG: class IV adenylate cyclase [Ignavibacteria bacterium]|nr:class IV adenylate cyclase [Ignavibacteria bacterium]
MQRRNIEIKAHCRNLGHVRDLLRAREADFRGTDHQIDTYFNVSNGRLKLREGTIENTLIHYDREDQTGPKQSNVTLYPLKPGSSLKDILLKVFDVLIVVDKHREIYFIDNVKFHLDSIVELGEFVEIEAIDSDGARSIESLREQCTSYKDFFGIAEEDLLMSSYSDMLLCAMSLHPR